MSSTTQLADTPRGEPCDVVIGFDFGTSCSKVVVRTPYEQAEAIAIDFGDVGHSSSPYLLPSVVWVDDEGTVTLGAHGNGVISNDAPSVLGQAAAPYEVREERQKKKKQKK